jgi:hypothetical protein
VLLSAFCFWNGRAQTHSLFVVIPPDLTRAVSGIDRLIAGVWIPVFLCMQYRYTTCGVCICSCISELYLDLIKLIAG